MMHTAKRRACALRLSPIGITSFCKEVANLAILTGKANIPCSSHFVNFDMLMPHFAALSVFSGRAAFSLPAPEPAGASCAGRRSML